MPTTTETRSRAPRWTTSIARALALTTGLLAVATAAPAHAQATADPRVGLPGGHWAEAGSAIRNLEQIGHVARPAGFFNAAVGGRRWLLGS